jgi:hypothetical protein
LVARDPSTSSLALGLVTAVSSQSAVSPLAGCPHATLLTEATGGKFVACSHWSDDPLPASDPVHTAAVTVDPDPGIVPMATQVDEVHEKPVIELAPVGNVSLIQVLAVPVPEEIGAVKTVGSVALVESPVPRARHWEEVGQVNLPKDVASEGTESWVKVGVHEALLPNVAGSPSRRRMTAIGEPEPKVADPLSSQVELVGQAIEDTLVKAIDAGAVPLHVVGVTRTHTFWVTAPARSTGLPAALTAAA